MGPRSSRVIEVLREAIRQAEQTPGLGPSDPGVIQLRHILTRWVEERNELEQAPPLNERPPTNGATHEER
jgi:hypothetical protein